MTKPTLEMIYRVLENTWPPASAVQVGPWIIREGAGGGQRVSAATAVARVDETDIERAEAAMTVLGQPRLFMIRRGDEHLDQLLARRCYRIVDPVSVYIIRPSDLLQRLPYSRTAYAIWPPLAVMMPLWEAGGIGPGRLAVMERANDPKISFLARAAERAAGCAFAAIHENIAMIHAIEVSETLRRNGAATKILRKCAEWAQDMDARWISLVVTDANSAANGLYSKLGMSVVGGYHYRRKE